MCARLRRWEDEGGRQDGKGLEWQQGKGTVTPSLGGSHIAFLLGLEEIGILS